jgi:hypothetical protein
MSLISPALLSITDEKLTKYQSGSMVMQQE